MKDVSVICVSNKATIDILVFNLTSVLYSRPEFTECCTKVQLLDPYEWKRLLLDEFDKLEATSRLI